MYYDPNNPTNASLSMDHQSIGWGVGLMVLGVVLIAFSWSWYFQDQRRKTEP